MSAASLFHCCCCFCCYCLVASVVSNSARPHRQQPTRLPHPWDSPGKNTGVGCNFLLQCRKVKSESEDAQSYPILRTAAYQAPPSMGFSRQEYGHYSFLNPHETIASWKYAQQIDDVHQKLQCLEQTLINRKGPILLHDNPQPRVAQPVLQKFNKLGYKVLSHPPCSPDLSTTTSSSFPTAFCRENTSTISRM